MRAYNIQISISGKEVANNKNMSIEELRFIIPQHLEDLDVDEEEVIREITYENDYSDINTDYDYSLTIQESYSNCDFEVKIGDIKLKPISNTYEMILDTSSYYGNKSISFKFTDLNEFKQYVLYANILKNMDKNDYYNTDFFSPLFSENNSSSDYWPFHEGIPSTLTNITLNYYDENGIMRFVDVEFTSEQYKLIKNK